MTEGKGTALGLALALTAALFWGALPVALKLLLEVFDPYTLTAIRFIAATLLLGAVMALLRPFEGMRAGVRRGWPWLLLALAGLAGNFVAFLLALAYVPATVGQVVSQLGPLFLLLGGLVLFGERLCRLQWGGVAVLLAGLALFFNDRLAALADLSGGFGLGVGLAVLGSGLWAMYGMAQKHLARHLRPQQTLLLLYPASALLLLPASSSVQHVELAGWQLGLLVFACVNTLVAYGAFAESLRHADATRVGAIVSLTPLITAGMAALAAVVAPAVVAPEGLNAWSYVGAAVVVAGSAVIALARPRRVAVARAEMAGTDG